MNLFEISPEAHADLFDIWRHVALDSMELADRVEAALYEAISTLSQSPGLGHSRRDLTNRPVLFFPVHSYLVVYLPQARPVRILAVLRGARNVRRVLKKRS